MKTLEVRDNNGQVLHSRKTPRTYTHAVVPVGPEGGISRDINGRASGVSYAGSLALAEKKLASREFGGRGRIFPVTIKAK